VAQFRAEAAEGSPTLTVSNAAVAWASLSISTPDGRKRHESLTRPVTLIGRSRNAGNDLILSDDGQVSKQHARIERERDGRFTIYDLGSTNGVLVNGQRIGGSQVLGDGDEIKIGASVLLFQAAGADQDDRAGRFAMIDAHSVRTGAPRRAVLVTPDGAQHILASETLIGRALTADIVLDSPGVSMRHARIISPDPASYFVEDLGSEAGTLINERPIAPRTRSPLASGDIVRTGPVELRFIGGAS
jgi:pSer/pThr/pTyr-binding forkhead associated (FHA) protein